MPGRQHRVCLSFPTEGWGSWNIYPPTLASSRVTLWIVTLWHIMPVWHTGWEPPVDPQAKGSRNTLVCETSLCGVPRVDQGTCLVTDSILFIVSQTPMHISHTHQVQRCMEDDSADLLIFNEKHNHQEFQVCVIWQWQPLCGHVLMGSQVIFTRRWRLSELMMWAFRVDDVASIVKFCRPMASTLGGGGHITLWGWAGNSCENLFLELKFFFS